MRNLTAVCLTSLIVIMGMACESTETISGDDADETEDAQIDTAQGHDDTDDLDTQAEDAPEDTSADDATEDSGDPPECDPAFAILPADPGTGSLLNISYTDAEPLTYVGISINGPGQSVVGDLDITENASDYTWSWPATVDAPGRYTVTFTYDQNPKQTGGSCEIDVEDTGAPPDIDPNDGDAGQCLCGEGDCQRCPVEGSCFDDPSPYSPSGSGTWQCLDTAGCSGGNCRIWCPFEPCPREDGQGCVNNTEACYVPPGITDYEEACRTCCESAPRNAEWNAEDNYCMEPRPL